MKKLSVGMVAAGVFLLATTLGTVSSANAQHRDRGMTVATDLTPADIIALGQFGAKVARYQFVFENADRANKEEYLAWLDSAIVKLDALLPVFQSAGLKVILDLHTPPGGFASKAAPASQFRIFTEMWAQRTLVTTWERLSEHYVGNTTIIGFDLCNEPAERDVASGLKGWSDLAAEVAATVRERDASHTIFVQAAYGNQALLKRLNPLPVSNVTYSFHMYFPLKFQQQGLYGNKLGVKYPTAKLTKASLKRALNDVTKYQKKNKVKFYVGEFSAVRWAPGKSSLNYLRDVISLFEKNKWDWTYHAWREADAWSVEHDGNIKNKTPVTFVTDRALFLKKMFARP